MCICIQVFQRENNGSLSSVCNLCFYLVSATAAVQPTWQYDYGFVFSHGTDEVVPKRSQSGTYLWMHFANTAHVRSKIEEQYIRRDVHKDMVSDPLASVARDESRLVDNKQCSQITSTSIPKRSQIDFEPSPNRFQTDPEPTPNRPQTNSRTDHRPQADPKPT